VLQFVPLLAALLFSAGVWAPQYLHHEANHGAESAGWVCLLLAAAVFLSYALGILRGIRLTVGTLRFNAACRRVGRIQDDGDDRVPIVATRHAEQPVALVGFIHPFILISRSLLEDGILEKATLEVALAHERSHAKQLDNWKLLSLAFLPRFLNRLPFGETWILHWRRAAEWAADDDAVHGDAARNFLLAQALIKVARRPTALAHTVALTALTPADADLAGRIDRLIHRPDPPDTRNLRRLGFAFVAVALVAAAAATCLTPVLYRISEYILHLT
jgi:beta-lactamase regulating signal transducer with metallopeptidase domain